MSSNADLPLPEELENVQPADADTVSPPMTDDALLDYRQCLAIVLTQSLQHGDSESFIHGVNEDIAQCDQEIRTRGLHFEM